MVAAPTLSVVALVASIQYLDWENINGATSQQRASGWSQSQPGARAQHCIQMRLLMSLPHIPTPPAHHSKLELTLGLLTRWHYQEPEEERLVLVFCCPAAALGFIQHQSSCILATCPLPGVGGTQKFIINIFVPKNASNCNKFDITLMYLTGCNIYFYDI